MPTKNDLLNKGLTLIPVNEVNIEKDPNKTTGYDFTVNDWFTFCTHDGVYIQDSVAIYIPISDNTIKEVETKIISTSNLINSSNDSLAMTPNQDIVLGIYFLTTNKFKSLNNKVVYKNQEMTESMKIFNECFPDDYPVINESINNKALIGILNDITKKYDKEVASAVLDNIKKIGFKYSTLYGTTLSLDLCRVEDLEDMKHKIYDTEDIIEQLNNVNSSEINNLLREKFNYSYMIDSGARGSWDQVKQVVCTRGFVSNFKGQIFPTAIKNSLIDGLTKEEFFNSTYGCRKGLMDVAINTGTSGYLSRKLIMSMVNLELDKNVPDCGTTDYFKLYVKNEHNARMVVHRYHEVDNKLEKITYDNYKNIIGKTINLRSPIFCKDHKLCKTCYGDLSEIINSRFVGVISAQALGETNTQMILRTFHTSGVASINKSGKTDSLLQQDIVADLSMTSKLLHGGAKEYNYDELIIKLFDVYNHSRRIHFIHFECLVSQMMWANNKKWRLLENRNEITPEYQSVQSIPTMESWLLGLAFSSPKKHIMEGIFYKDNYKGIIDKLLCGEKVN